MSIYHGHFIKRGFLLGPLCVVYGIASILVIYIFNYIKSHPFILFLSSSILTTIIELIAGAILKNCLNHKLWDYSGNYGSYLGFICLRNTILWGILSLLVVYFIHPRIIKLVNLIPVNIKELAFYSILALLSLDITVSIYTGFKNIDSIAWVSDILVKRVENIENVTSKVVYFMSH
jgi:uncharacterized membrane protein